MRKSLELASVVGFTLEFALNNRKVKIFIIYCLHENNSYGVLLIYCIFLLFKVSWMGCQRLVPSAND